MRVNGKMKGEGLEKRGRRKEEDSVVVEGEITY
jgi:hypothetical protein